MWRFLWSRCTSSTPLLSQVLSDVLHVRAQLAAVEPEPRELASRPAVSDRAGGDADLIRDLFEGHGQPAVALGQEHGLPETHPLVSSGLTTPRPPWLAGRTWV